MQNSNSVRSVLPLAKRVICWDAHAAMSGGIALLLPNTGRVDVDEAAPLVPVLALLLLLELPAALTLPADVLLPLRALLLPAT